MDELEYKTKTLVDLAKNLKNIEKKILDAVKDYTSTLTQTSRLMGEMKKEVVDQGDAPLVDYFNDAETNFRKTDVYINEVGSKIKFVNESLEDILAALE